MARVEQARKNIKYSTIAYILKITLQFVVRLVFVKSLPIEYLGINGLLSNFLSMLSLAELGVGPAIIYSLYQPLAKKDTATIKALIALFKKAEVIFSTFLKEITTFLFSFNAFFNISNTLSPSSGNVQLPCPTILKILTFSFLIF